MIPSFSSSTDPYLPIHVSIGGSFFYPDAYPDAEFDTEALLDTGYSGGLSVPPALIPAALSPVSQTIWGVAAGVSDHFRLLIDHGKTITVEL
jgi:hypothetical protein